MKLIRHCFPLIFASMLWLSPAWGLDEPGEYSNCQDTLSEVTAVFYQPPVISCGDTTNVVAQTCDPAQVGITSQLLTNAYGCDSLVITTTVLLPGDTTNVVAQTCDPAQVGITSQLLTNAYGCDSLVITTTVLLPGDTTNVVAQTCDPAQVGITSQLLTNAYGCDSLVITTTVLLPGDTTNVVAQTCDPAQVGITSQLLTNAYGCDSLVITTTVLLPGDTTNVVAQTCDPAQVGITSQLLTNAYGCDSLVITTTVLLPGDTTNVVAQTCDPAQVGITSQLLTNAYGCDSLVITTTVLRPDHYVDRKCLLTNWGDDVTAAQYPNIANENHAVYLYNFPDGSGGTLDPRFLWDTMGMMTLYNDGTGLITGKVVNAQDANVRFEVNFLLKNRMDWTTWSGLGRTYKNDSPFNTIGNTEYVNWDYFEFSSSSTLTGSAGSTYDGDVITLTHRPADLMMGPQLGIGANDKDESEGFSAWFFWSGTLGGTTYTHLDGDINVDADCTTSPCSEYQDAGLHVAAKVMLEGPYNPNTAMMNDALRTLNYLPITEPYTGLGYPHTGNGGGEQAGAGVLTMSGNAAAVDWVFVELRKGTNASSRVATISGILQRDGDIVSAADGVSPLVFTGVSAGAYYVVIKHRTHLGIMSASPINLSATSTTVDFTDGSTPTFGAGAQHTIPGTSLYYMWCGDSNSDGAVDAVDRSNLWNDRDQSGYLPTDINCDGQVGAPDRSAAWNTRDTFTKVPNN